MKNITIKFGGNSMTLQLTAETVGEVVNNPNIVAVSGYDPAAVDTRIDGVSVGNCTTVEDGDVLDLAPRAHKKAA